MKVNTFYILSCLFCYIVVFTLGNTQIGEAGNNGLRIQAMGNTYIDRTYAEAGGEALAPAAIDGQSTYMFYSVKAEVPDAEPDFEFGSASGPVRKSVYRARNWYGYDGKSTSNIYNNTYFLQLNKDARPGERVGELVSFIHEHEVESIYPFGGADHDGDHNIGPMDNAHTGGNNAQ